MGILKGHIFVFICLSMISLSCYSSSKMEVIGTSYEIKEVSLLDEIMRKLKEKKASGEMERMQKKMEKKSISNIENPQGITLPISTNHSVRFFDPSIVLDKPVTLENGVIIHEKGTIINPLSIRPFTKKLIFIDGSIEAQVKYAISQFKESGYRDKIILISGAFGDLTRKYKVRFYFDQQMKTGIRGRLTLVEKFGIKSVPSIVYQRDKEEYFLTIEEIKL